MCVNPKSHLMEMSHLVKMHVSWKFNVSSSGNSISCFVEIFSTENFDILYVKYLMLPHVSTSVEMKL